MSEFQRRVIEAINAVIRRSATYPNALYLGQAEQRQLRQELERGGADTNRASGEYLGLSVFRVDEPSHFAAVWSPALAGAEPPSGFRLDYIAVRPIGAGDPIDC